MKIVKVFGIHKNNKLLCLLSSKKRCFLYRKQIQKYSDEKTEFVVDRFEIDRFDKEIFANVFYKGFSKPEKNDIMNIFHLMEIEHLIQLLKCVRKRSAVYKPSYSNISHINIYINDNYFLPIPAKLVRKYGKHLL